MSEPPVENAEAGHRTDQLPFPVFVLIAPLRVQLRFPGDNEFAPIATLSSTVVGLSRSAAAVPLP